MLLSQNLVKEALWKASSTGADYAEVFAEYTNSKTISMISSKVDKIAEIPTDANDKPTSDVVIKTATVIE